MEKASLEEISVCMYMVIFHSIWQFKNTLYLNKYLTMKYK